MKALIKKETSYNSFKSEIEDKYILTVEKDGIEILKKDFEKEEDAKKHLENFKNQYFEPIETNIIEETHHNIIAKLILIKKWTVSFYYVYFDDKLITIFIYDDMISEEENHKKAFLLFREILVKYVEPKTEIVYTEEI
jgi:hypothetical protein